MKGNHDHAEGKTMMTMLMIYLHYNLSMMEGAYAALQMPMEDGSDNMQIGLGFALNVWNGLYVEPNYMMPVSEDDNGERKDLQLWSFIQILKRIIF